MTRIPIGGRLRERRKAMGVTQAALAAQLQISPSYLNLIEADRRRIGGALLLRAAQALGLPLEALDDAAERLLADQLREVAAAPLLAALAPPPEGAAELVARQPAWARALLRLHRAWLDRDAAVQALSARLSQDPALAQGVHALLTQVSAIRSAAEILEAEPDLPATQRRRFVANVAEDSRRLSQVSQALASHVAQVPGEARPATPSDAVDAFVLGHDNHFPTLEAGADALRARLAPRGGPLREDLLWRHLRRAHGLRPQPLEMVAPAGIATAGAAAPTPAQPLRVDAAAGIVLVHPLAAATTRRFALARLLAERDGAGLLDAALAGAADLAPAGATAPARGALAAYMAAALLMPYDAFREAALSSRCDLDALARRFDTSEEQVARRLVTLRRPGAEGPRLGFVRSDAAGHLSLRLPLPRQSLPRHGPACPLWPLYEALQSPGATLARRVVFPDGEQAVMVARSIDKPRADPRAPRRIVAIQLTVDALQADRLVAADGLDLAPGAAALPVGPACRLCPRTACDRRQEPALLPALPPS